MGKVISLSIKEEIKELVFVRPNLRSIVLGIITLFGVFTLLFLNSITLKFIPEIYFWGFIASGIIIGLNFVITRNLIFPILIILIYNFTIDHLTATSINIPLTILFGIGQGLFIVNISIFISYLTYTKTKKFVLTKNSGIIAGGIFGVLLNIVAFILI